MASARIQLMIGGAEKSGTSSLKHYVGEHPAISMHAQDEIMHFALEDQHALGFDHARERYYPDASGVLAGKSVAVMHLDRASERLRDHNPEVRVVLLLRNPVDRAYSAYWHARRRGWEHLATFEAALDAEERRRTANGTSEAHRLLYRQRGRYVQQVERLMGRFPDTLHVYLLEDLDAEPVRVCQSIYADIGVDTTFVPDVRRQYNPMAAARSERFAGLLSKDSGAKRMLKRIAPQRSLDRMRRGLDRFNSKEFVPPPMDASTRQRLLDEFREPNDELSVLIGRDLSAWAT